MWDTRFKLVTFDVYSALVDIEGSLLPLVRPICGTDAEALSFIRLWRSKQLEAAQLVNSLEQGYIPFSLLTHRALTYAIARTGMTVGDAKVHELVASWYRLQPWPEAAETVRAINALGRPVALLSNGDEAMLRAFADTFDARFDHVFASDHAGKYKPHPAIYALPSRALGLQPNDILHVAGSGNDVIGCKHAGLACAWTNRSGDVLIDPDVHPEHELRTLAELIDFI